MSILNTLVERARKGAKVIVLPEGQDARVVAAANKAVDEKVVTKAIVLGSEAEIAEACAKAGVDMLTQYTALQYGKQNIRCNCVRPGLIVTPQNEAKVPQALKDIFLDNIEVARYGTPEDIAAMCVYLASDESSYFTGQVVTV